MRSKMLVVAVLLSCLAGLRFAAENAVGQQGPPPGPPGPMGPPQPPPVPPGPPAPAESGPDADSATGQADFLRYPTFISGRTGLCQLSCSSDGLHLSELKNQCPAWRGAWGRPGSFRKSQGADHHLRVLQSQWADAERSVQPVRRRAVLRWPGREPRCPGIRRSSTRMK